MTTVKTDIGARDDAYRTRFAPTGGITATDVQRAIVEAAADAASVDAEYLLGAAHGELTNGRIPTTTATVSWDFATANQAKANVVAGSIDNTVLADMAQARIKGRAAAAGTGDPQDLTEAQVKTILGFPTATTDNTVPRFDGTGGNLQTSGIVIDDSNFLSGAAGVGIGGASPDATNRLSVNAPAVLFNRETDDIQVKLNKQAASDTASFLFQTGFSGRAEIGLVGDDDFAFKTSPDGAVFLTGILIDKDDATVIIPVRIQPDTNDGAALGVSGTAWSDLFLASGGVINWAAGDVTLTHAANTLSFDGASSGYQFAGGPIQPVTNDGVALGVSGTAFSDLFLASGGVINFNAGDVTLTHSANALAFAGAASGYSFDAVVTVTDDLQLVGATPVLAFTDTDTNADNFISAASGALEYDADFNNETANSEHAFYVDGAAKVSITATSLNPFTNDNLPLGTNTVAWSDLFLASGGVINWDNGNATLAHSASLITSSVAFSVGTGNAITAGTIELGHASDTTLARSAAGVVTIESAVIRTAGKETIWVPAGAMTARTTNGAASVTTELASNDVMLTTKDFDQTTEEGVQFHVAMPKNWNESTVTFQPYWTAASGSGGVVWECEALARSDDDPLDTAFGTGQTSTDTLIATNDLHIGPESSAITIGGTPAENDDVIFQITRVTSNGSDTLTADAKLIGVKIFVTLNAANDA